MVFALQYMPAHAAVSEKADSMNPKLTILFMLIGAVIGLSYLSDERLDRMRRRFVSRRWRQLAPLRRRP